MNNNMIQLTDIDDKNLYYDTLSIPYTVVKSKRKSLAIAIGIGGSVIVKVPLQVRAADVKRLLQKKQEWIYSTYQKQSIRKREGILIKEGTMIPYQDKQYPLRIEYQPYHKVANIFIRNSVNEDGNRESNLIITTPCTELSFVKKCLEEWYKKNARTVIANRVAYYASIMGVSYGRIAIRSQKSRWGSCSFEGNLNFNWHLIMMPSQVLDYVVIHELAHRIEMNHSKQFWLIVAKFCPDYLDRKKWLKEFGLRFDLVLD